MKIINLFLKNKNYNIKQLYLGRLNKTGGRNNSGHITLRARGGGHKQKLRFVNFKYLLWNIYAIVLTVEYSAKRSGFVSLICYSNGILTYIMSIDGVYPGSLISMGVSELNNYVFLKKNTNTFFKGYISIISSFLEGSFLSCVEVSFLKGAKIARAAGTSIQLVKKNYLNNFALVRLPSGEEKLVYNKCIAALGPISNKIHFLKFLRKAGQNRNLGFRSQVRGVAMNPVDHPHGGGQGKTKGAGGFRSQVTFKGLPAKNKATRSKKKSSSFIVSFRK